MNIFGVYVEVFMGLGENIWSGINTNILFTVAFNVTLLYFIYIFKSNGCREMKE